MFLIRAKHLLASFGFLLFIASFTTLAPTPSYATDGWCTARFSGPKTCGFPTANDACLQQWLDFGQPFGSTTFMGASDYPSPWTSWSTKQCHWSTGLGIPAPALVGFECGTYPQTPMLGGTCRDDTQGSAALPIVCNCESNNGGTAITKTPYPIELMSGSKYFEATDFHTSDDSLTLRRIYNSTPYGGTTLKAYNLPLGLANWRYDFQLELQLGYDWVIGNTVDLVTPFGAIHGFQKQTSGALTPYPGTTFQTEYTLAFVGTWPSTLSNLTNSTSTWTLTDPDDNVWTLQTFLDPISSTYVIARPTKRVTRNGLEWDFAYDSSYHLTSITDSYGKQITFTWSGDAISIATLPSGDTINYTYAAVDSSALPEILTGVDYVDMSGMSPVVQDTTTYQYGNSSFPFHLTGILDKNNVQRWSVTYDSIGRAITSTGPSNADKYTVSYATAGSTFSRTVTNGLGKQTTYNYANNYPFYAKFTGVTGVASTNTPSSSTSVSYSGNFISSTTDEEGRVTNYTRNSRGLPTQTVEAYGTGVARTTNFTWHSTMAVPTQVQQPSLTTDYTYNSQDQLTSLTQTDTTSTSTPYSTNGQTRTWAYTWSSTGQLLTVNGPLAGTGDTVTYTYDMDGYLATITNELSQVTTINTVNDRGQPTQITDPNSVVINLAYDALGHLTSTTVNPGGSQAVTAFQYNAVGDITRITKPDGSYLDYTYNDERRVTAVTNNLGEEIDYSYNYSGGVTQTDVKDAMSTIVATQSKTYDELNRLLQQIGASSQTTSFTYDKVNNQKTITDPRSKLYSNAFDALNRLSTETDPDSYVTTTAYNGKDEATSVTDARSKQTAYVRDGFGDVIRQTSPDSGTTDFWYDAAGRMTKKVDARSIETDFTNDVTGRVLTKTFPASSGENVTYAYDSTTSGNKGIGHLTSITDGSGSTSFTYNALGQITRERRVIQSITYDTDYTFDAAGNVLTMTYPSGRIVTYTRDAVGHITDVTTKQNSMASSVNIATGATYNPFGPLTGLTFGNSVGLTITYDSDMKLTEIQASVGMTTIQDLTYGYDNAGNITGITDNYQSARSQTLGYDNLNRLNSASGAYGSIAFTYDGVGNRATRVISGTTETFNTSSTSNRLNTISIGGSTVRTLSYTNSGQVSQDVRSGSATYGFTYNNDGRISSASLNSSTVGTYLYNGIEQRVSKTASSVTTHDMFDRFGHLLSEDDGSGNPIREYIWLDDIPVAMIDHSGMSPVVYFVHTDHLGKPQKITDGSAALVWDAVFKPFGEVYSVSGTATNLLMFPGQLYDSETALAQNWNRDYDATLGRYIQSDPIGLNGGINTYGYVGGNPETFADPEGTGPLGTMVGGWVGGPLGGLFGGFAGGAAGTLAEPGGGTVAGGVVGAEEGAIYGRAAGRVIGSAIEDIILAMAAQHKGSPAARVPTKSANEACPNGDECDRHSDTDQALCHGIAGARYGYRGVAKCMAAASQRYAECLKGGVKAIRTPLSGVETPL